MEIQRQNVTIWTPTEQQESFVKAMLEGEKQTSITTAAKTAGVTIKNQTKPDINLKFLESVKKAKNFTKLHFEINYILLEK